MNTFELSGALQGTTLHTLLLLVSKALARSGYGDVEIMDRRHERQKSRFGGHELLCTTSVGDRQIKVLVKVLKEAIRVRNLDEMCGTIGRMQADLGLVVSRMHITKDAKRLLPKFEGSRVSAIDGETLALLMEKHKIGVRGGGVDYAFFGELEEVSDRVLLFLDSLRHDC